MTKIAIVGPGAVAGIIAWHLARAGLAPAVVARRETASLIAREGLTLTGAGVDEAVAVSATSDPRALGPQDAILVGFKAHDWIAGLDTVLPLIGPSTIIVPMLNGVPWWFFQGFGGEYDGRNIISVDPDGLLARSLPQELIAGCVVYVAASRETPARIRWNGRNRMILGSLSQREDGRIATLVAILKSAGIDAKLSADIRREVWMKLLGNVTYNPLSVVAGVRIGRMGTHEPLRRIVRAIMEETVAIGRALGIVDAIDLEERLRVPAEMHEIKTSMLQDYEAGRPLELGAIVDAVVELGALTGVATPMTEAIGALAAERARLARASTLTSQDRTSR
jgi:2-dehydropantoate 2-reductase